MSNARKAVTDVTIGRKLLEESRKGRTLSNLLDTDAEIRQTRLKQAREGAKALVQGTRATNKLVRLRNTLDSIRRDNTARTVK